MMGVIQVVLNQMDGLVQHNSLILAQASVGMVKREDQISVTTTTLLVVTVAI